MTVQIEDVRKQASYVIDMHPGVVVEVSKEYYMVTDRRLDDRIVMVKLGTGVQVTAFKSTTGIEVGRTLCIRVLPKAVALSTVQAGQVVSYDGSVYLSCSTLGSDNSRRLLNLLNGKLIAVNTDTYVTETTATMKISLHDLRRVNDIVTM